MGLLRTLFWVFIGFVVIRLLRGGFNRSQDERQPDRRKNNGRTTIQYKPGQTRSAVKDSAGEFVEYEEVDG